MPDYASFVKKNVHCIHIPAQLVEKRNCHAQADTLYCPCMSNEPQTDLNQFNSWDCFGATLMLTVVPAIMYYVFSPEHEIGTTIFIASIGVAISVFVLVLALVTRWRFIGTMVNFLGTVLAHVYVVIAICAWWPSDEEANVQPKQKLEQPAEARP